MTLCPNLPSGLEASFPVALEAALDAALPAAMVADATAPEPLDIMAELPDIIEDPLIIELPVVMAPPAPPPKDDEPMEVDMAMDEEPEQPACVGKSVTPAPLQRLAANW